MTDMNKDKKVMSAQELENVSGGLIFPRRVNFPEQLPINFPRFGAGRSTEKPIFTFVANAKPVCSRRWCW